VKLLGIRKHPDHALLWPGKIVAVFFDPPMKYVLVYEKVGDQIVAFAWPKSLDEALARSLIPTLTKALKSSDN